MPHAAALALWLHQHLGWIPFFDVGRRPERRGLGRSRATSRSAFCAGIAVAMMVLPMACAVMRQVFSQTPPGEKEAALALGATRWGMVRAVVLPFGRGGIIGGTMLGLGRALGETIAVLLIISPGVRDQAAHPRDRHQHRQRADRRPLRRGQRRPALRAAGRRLRAVPDHAGRQHARRDHRQPQPLRRRDGRLMTDARPTERPPTRARPHLPGVRRRRAAAGPARRRSAGRPPTSGSPWSAPGSAALALAWLVTQRLLPLGGLAVAPRRPGSCSGSLVTAVTGVDDRRPRRRRGPGRRARSSPRGALVVGAALVSTIVFVVVRGWRAAAAPRTSSRRHGRRRPDATRSTSGGIAARDRRLADRARHRDRDHAAARHRHRGLHDRGRRPVRRRRAHRRRGDDRAALDRGRPVHLHRAASSRSGFPRSGLAAALALA